MKLVLGAVGAIAAGVVLYLLGLTLLNVYPGANTGWWGPPERPATAEVGTCEQRGPVSDNGFGFWWKCDVTVRAEDGRVVRTTVDRSIVTPADAGKPVEFREACKSGTTDCSYGRPAGRGWTLLLGVVGLLQWVILAGLALFAVICLVRAALGRHRYGRLADAWVGKSQRQ
ncbi:MAG: hypothetical protein HOV77_17430 [Hamadaea sp.]|uniref:DUF6346 domain-containing protein n=1 Tax=Hamadaea sp. TaxID=2024425 RepID=UPI0017C74AD9|nr:DUF6346 domain-containing protein [Hamadaea sp.]NUT20965.1 hypothetical protein [Hamadaea sp.]